DSLCSAVAAPVSLTEAGCIALIKTKKSLRWEHPALSHTHTHAHTHIHTHTYTHTYTHIQTHSHTQIHLHTHRHTLVHTHTHTHTHSHTFTPMQLLAFLASPCISSQAAVNGASIHTS